MNFRRYFLLFFAAALSLGGCVVYEPAAVVAPQQTTAQRFDRSWSAALGAMSDQGLTITSQDYGAGVITGRQGGVMISATLQALPDGSVQVKFASQGRSGDDPGLIDRVSSGFDRRMGR
jgi:hypothetical protein